MSGITLYGPAEAPFTVKVERALQLKGVEYLLVAPESPEDYRRWNPKTGLLPVLEIDGQIYLSGTEQLPRPVQPGDMVSVTITQSSDYDLAGDVVRIDEVAAAPSARVRLRVLSSDNRELS